MAPLAFLLAAAAPATTLAHSLADYSQCLRVSAGRPAPGEAAARAQYAIEQCRSQRETTIRLAIELVAGRSSPERARARTDQALAEFDALFPAILAAGGGVEIPPPIAPQVRRYVDCVAEQLQTRGSIGTGDAAAYAAVVEASIATCATVRTSALAEAETVLSRAPGFEEPRNREEAIGRAFDQTDAVQRNFFRIMDTVSHDAEAMRRITNLQAAGDRMEAPAHPSPSSPDAGLEAAHDYGSCVGMTAVLRSATTPVIDEAIAEAFQQCSAKRQAALTAATASLEARGLSADRAAQEADQIVRENDRSLANQLRADITALRRTGQPAANAPN
jgi:hypothetical protein